MGEQIGSTVYYVFESIITLVMGGLSIFKPRFMMKLIFRKENVSNKWIMLAYFIGVMFLTRVLNAVIEIGKIWS
jgi:cytochrome b subunit of formate dehydrogenase